MTKVLLGQRSKMGMNTTCYFWYVFMIAALNCSYLHFYVHGFMTVTTAPLTISTKSSALLIHATNNNRENEIRKKVRMTKHTFFFTHEI